jgi:hypothetical protein
MSDAPQVAYDVSPQPYHDDHSQKLPVPATTLMQKPETYAYYDEGHQLSRSHPSTILGLRKSNFWILVLIAFIVVAVTIGGSVGGSMAVRNNKCALHHCDLRRAITNLLLQHFECATVNDTHGYITTIAYIVVRSSNISNIRICLYIANGVFLPHNSKTSKSRRD